MNALRVKEAYNSGYLSELQEVNPFDVGSDEYFAYQHGRNMVIQDSLLSLHTPSILTQEGAVMSSFFIVFMIIMTAIVIFSILLLVSAYYSHVNKGDEIEFELNGVKDRGVVEYIKEDWIYVIAESNPDHYTVITYENVL